MRQRIYYLIDLIKRIEKNGLPIDEQTLLKLKWELIQCQKREWLGPDYKIKEYPK